MESLHRVNEWRCSSTSGVWDILHNCDHGHSTLRFPPSRESISFLAAPYLVPSFFAGIPSHATETRGGGGGGRGECCERNVFGSLAINGKMIAR